MPGFKGTANHGKGTNGAAGKQLLLRRTRKSFENSALGSGTMLLSPGTKGLGAGFVLKRFGTKQSPTPTQPSWSWAWSSDDDEEGRGQEDNESMDENVELIAKPSAPQPPTIRSSAPRPRSDSESEDSESSDDPLDHYPEHEHLRSQASSAGSTPSNPSTPQPQAPKLLNPSTPKPAVTISTQPPQPRSSKSQNQNPSPQHLKPQHLSPSAPQSLSPSAPPHPKPQTPKVPSLQHSDPHPRSPKIWPQISDSHPSAPHPQDPQPLDPSAAYPSGPRASQPPKSRELRTQQLEEFSLEEAEGVTGECDGSGAQVSPNAAGLRSPGALDLGGGVEGSEPRGSEKIDWLRRSGAEPLDPQPPDQPLRPSPRRIRSNGSSGDEGKDIFIQEPLPPPRNLRDTDHLLRIPEPAPPVLGGKLGLDIASPGSLLQPQVWPSSFNRVLDDEPSSNGPRGIAEAPGSPDPRFQNSRQFERPCSPTIFENVQAPDEEFRGQANSPLLSASASPRLRRQRNSLTLQAIQVEDERLRPQSPIFVPNEDTGSPSENRQQRRHPTHRLESPLKPLDGEDDAQRFGAMEQEDEDIDSVFQRVLSENLNKEAENRSFVSRGNAPGSFENSSQEDGDASFRREVSDPDSLKPDDHSPTSRRPIALDMNMVNSEILRRTSQTRGDSEGVSDQETKPNQHPWRIKMQRLASDGDEEGEGGSELARPIYSGAFDSNIEPLTVGNHRTSKSFTRLSSDGAFGSLASSSVTPWKTLRPPPASRNAMPQGDDSFRRACSVPDEPTASRSPPKSPEVMSQPGGMASPLQGFVNNVRRSFMRRSKTHNDLVPDPNRGPPSPSALSAASSSGTGLVSEALQRMGSAVGLTEFSLSTPKAAKVNPFLQRYSFAGNEDLDRLLEVLGLEYNDTEKEDIQCAFMCHVCDSGFSACTTTADQIRAVHDAFSLIDANGDGIITRNDLRDIASWTSDGDGMEFINNLINMLNQRHRGLRLLDGAEEDKVPIMAKDFVLAFARCIAPNPDIPFEESLDNRAVEYRKIGKLFGMEKVEQRFSWTKFWWTFLSDSLAAATFPLSKLVELRGPNGKSLAERLTEAQWLPVPYTTFDSFQYYLMKLWVPSFLSAAIFVIWYDDMDHISALEVISPIFIFLVVGTYISTISGYEHARLVLRRLNPALSSDAKQNELQAIFAFRAHTPEGHIVDQIGTIADTLFAHRFRWLSNRGAALTGIVHGIMPTIHRAWYAGGQGQDGDTCTDPGDNILSQVYFWVCGGHQWIHPIVSLPAAAVSGYLTYRLVYITCVGFYNDLSFYYRLILFRATTQAEPFLRYRARWIRSLERNPGYKGRRDFVQFLNLQKQDDLLLWCRIRQLLVESYAGFKHKQGDIMVTFILLSVLCYTVYILVFQFGTETKQLTVFDLRARMDVFVFSFLLIVIVNLKLSIHALRKSDIQLLHKELYAASMAMNSEILIQTEIGRTNSVRPSQGFMRQPSTSRGRRGSEILRGPGSDAGNQSPLSRIVPPTPGQLGPDDDVISFLRLNQMKALSSPLAQTRSRRSSQAHLDPGIYPTMLAGGEDPGFLPADAPEAAKAALKASMGVQNLLEHTARYIAEFDKPPRLLSFTVNIHLLRYIFLPLLSPIIAALTGYRFGRPRY